jgi:pseudoazurin
MKSILTVATVAALMTGICGAWAAEHEVHMLNKGAKGAMVFEPDFIRAEPGDTIRFIPADKTHNAESIPGMLPAGAEAFKGKVNEEVTITVTQEGVYGIRCQPHYAMGMVALVAVGAPVNLEEAQAVKHPGVAKKRFAAIFTDNADALK